jgi:hypothetical protein
MNDNNNNEDDNNEVGMDDSMANRVLIVGNNEPAALAQATVEEYNEDDGDETTPDIEIVGLHSPTNGRSCTIHDVCGVRVQKGDLIRLVRTVVVVRGQHEPAVKCVRVMDGVDGCTVAFVPKIWMNLQTVQENINNFVVVKELYRDSHNYYKKEKSSRFFGMASCYFLSSIERDK